MRYNVEQFIEIATSGADLDAAAIFARGEVHPESEVFYLDGRWIVV